ncbi:40S ribosomal protein S5-1 [Hordeum vulgare]|nr:40S ribosomal protein S5-1 [Hordeum vulgare]
MMSPKAPKDKIFEKVINPYLMGVLQHPQSIEMREGMLHIRDVEGPKKTGSMEARLEAIEQQVFKCQGMVERGLKANHMMITEFTSKHKIDANDIGKHLSRLYDRIDHLQAQIYDVQNQNSRMTLVTPLVVLAASTMTPTSSAPIPDFSGSTTKAEEVSEVIRDKPPVCITMVPVDFLTKCSTQVDTIGNIDEIHDAATTVHLEPMIDSIHQALE